MKNYPKLNNITKKERNNLKNTHKKLICIKRNKP